MYKSFNFAQFLTPFAPVLNEKYFQIFVKNIQVQTVKKISFVLQTSLMN